jgi:hypothetical protein
MQKIRFITSAYGDAYIGFLLTNLFSIEASNPHAAITVYWQDISSSLTVSIQAAFPRVTFITTSFSFSTDIIERISSKTRIWAQACAEYPEAMLCFVDSDTLVLQDVRSAFTEDADIWFTEKDERVPLNTGVLFAKTSPAVVSFFAEWKDQTLAIIKNKESFAEANSSKLPYGGADQMSLYKMIGYERGKKVYSCEAHKGQVIVRAHACSMFNETRSVPISEETHIIHYKGGWHPILLQGAGFSRNRPRLVSWEMYIHYLDSVDQVFAKMKKMDPSFTMANMHIKYPWYMNKETKALRPMLYILFLIKDALYWGVRKLKRLPKKIRGL